jgi:hypothetical protein
MYIVYKMNLTVVDYIFSLGYIVYDIAGNAFFLEYINPVSATGSTDVDYINGVFEVI